MDFHHLGLLPQAAVEVAVILQAQMVGQAHLVAAVAAVEIPTQVVVAMVLPVELVLVVLVQLVQVELVDAAQAAAVETRAAQAEQGFQAAAVVVKMEQQA